MKNSKEIEQDFKDELSALCEKYRASITLENVGRFYEHSYVIDIYTPVKYDIDGNVVSESASFNIGNNF